MRKYQEVLERKLQRVVCNQCGKELHVEDGNLREGCFSADVVFGYFSRKDGLRHRFDLCEDCYDKITAQFTVPVEEEALTELL